jgi:hypothetical protein
MQVWVAKGISPVNKMRLMVEHGVAADVLDGIEVLVRDGYPWPNAVQVAAAMKANGGKSVVEESHCRYMASDQPRVLPGRHRDDCEVETCAGCLPCPMDHCRVCGVEHSVGACAGCVGEVRENLGELVRMCAALPPRPCTAASQRGDGAARPDRRP